MAAQRKPQPDSPATALPLPYGRHLIEADDVAAVVALLSALTHNAPLTQGPRVQAFEHALAQAVGARCAVACASGTAALHLALRALDVDGRHACIVPSITFLATASAVRHCNAEVIFADVDPDTGLMGPEHLAEALARADRPVKAALPVHLGGRPCDMAALAPIAQASGVALIEDGCHALGAASPHGRVGDGRHSAATVFSFHPVKTIACGEGGGVTLNDPVLAERIARLRNHGVTRDGAEMTDPDLSLDGHGAPNPWSYEQLELGFNYRMSELEAALGLSQLGKLDRFTAHRRVLSDLYDELLAPLSPLLRPVKRGGEAAQSLHLYGVLINFDALGLDRAGLMRGLEARGIGTQVHYIPVYRQPYFAARYGAQRLAGAEGYYARALSLPLHAGMNEDDVRRVCAALAAEMLRGSG